MKNNKFKKISITTILALAIMIAFSKPVQAQYDGEDRNCEYNLTIDKKISKNNLGEYYDNYTTSSYIFRAGDILYFQVRLRNNSENTYSNIELKDSIPQYVEPVNTNDPVDGHESSYSGRNIYWKVDEIKPNSEKFYYIKVRVVEQNKLPADEYIAQRNKIFLPAVGNACEDYDDAQFYLTRKPYGTSVTAPGLSVTPVPGQVQGQQQDIYMFPATGQELHLLAAVGLLWLAHKGYMMTRTRRKSK